MFGQNGFGDDSPETSRLSKANKDSDEMEDENGQLAHNSSYSWQNPLQFRAKFRIRQAQDTGPTGWHCCTRVFQHKSVMESSL